MKEERQAWVWRRAPALPAAAVAWLAYPVAGASLAASPPEGAEHRHAFEAMMAEPADAERAFRFAQVAATSGDVRGAIAALERILRINPGLGNVQLELGVLYLRAGETTLAASYLRDAMLARDMPDPVRERAQALLARAERARQRHFFSGSIYAGARHDSNANAAPTSRQVRVGGFDGLLSESATGRSDSSLELSGVLNYVYGLETQAGHELEANLHTYNRRYSRTARLNLTSIGADFGPRFQVQDLKVREVSLRPYVLASHALLDDAPYLTLGGAGLNLRVSNASGTHLDTSMEATDHRYRNAAGRPTTADRSGTFLEWRTTLAQQLRATTQVFGTLALAKRDSDQRYESFGEHGFRVGVSQAHPAPFALTRFSWTSTLSAGIRRSRYVEADPAIDPSRKRDDERHDVTLAINARVTSALMAVASVQYSNNRSSLPNFQYHNTGVSLGLAWSF